MEIVTNPFTTLEDPLFNYFFDLVGSLAVISGLFFIHNEIFKEQMDVIRKQENILLLTSRLKSMGEMAAGIAHEINNPLAIISGHAQLLVTMGEIGTIQEEQVAVNSKKIISTVERISSIVKSLKKLSHGKVDSEYEHLLVTDIFHEVESIIVAKLKASNVSIEFNLEDETLEFNGSLTLIGQVLLNLITNSVQAIEENEEKWVKVSGETTHDSIFITVRDSGPGISPDVAENIFNPFFTTKSVGEGTGIGLALCRTAIERMNGKLYLNEKSPNTEFVIVLPKTSSKSLIQKESA